VLGAQDEIVARDRDVVGMIVYSPEGRMAVQIMYRRGRPVVSAKKDVVSTGLGLGEIRWSAEDARAAIDTYDAYFGTYEVDREQSIVTHHVLGELRPPGVGARYRRRYELRGDDLWLSSTDSKERWRIVWRRVR
jgi:hypothetical protein